MSPLGGGAIGSTPLGGGIPAATPSTTTFAAAFFSVLEGTYDGLIQWPDRDLVVLLELEPSIELPTWAASTIPSDHTYQADMARFVCTDTFPGGLYRKVIGVRLDATDLTAQDTLGDVDATAGSFWWDEANALLYVHSPGGGDPGTYTAVQAFVRFHLATTGITLNLTDGDPESGVYYHPWLPGTLPELSATAEDFLVGLQQTEGGSVALANGHALFHVLSQAPYQWRNKRARFFLGGQYNHLTLPRSAFETWVTMLVDTLAPGEVTCDFQLKPIHRIADQELPITPLFETEYSNLGSGVRGTSKMLGYGRAIVRPDLVDTTDFGVYLVADASKQTLFAVHAVYAVFSDGSPQGLTAGLHYTVDLTACTITIIDPDHAWQNCSIQADVTGKPSGGSYLKHVGEIALDILTTWLGVPANTIDLDAFTQADLDAPSELAVWIKSPRQASSIFASAEEDQPSLQRSTLARIFQTREGLWTIKVWTPGAPVDAAVIGKTDFAAFLPQASFQPTCYQVRVQYARNLATDTFALATFTNPKTQYLSETTDVMTIPTFLAKDFNALGLARRLLYAASTPSIDVDFVERGAKLALSSPGEKVLVTFDPAPDATGAWADQLLEIGRIDRSIAEVLTVGGRVRVNAIDAHGPYYRWAGNTATAATWGSSSPFARWY